MSDMKKVTCPHCGKELDIPAELEEFSCLYCGGRTALKVEVKAPQEFDAAREKLRGKLAAPVVNYPDSLKNLTKKLFFDAFETYEKENEAVFAELDACAVLHPDGVAAGAKLLAGDMLKEVIAGLEQEKKWKSRNGRDSLMFSSKVTMAVFLTPAVRRQKLVCAEDFRRELNEQWLARYPKQEWIPGDYDVMVEGFRRKKWCFITTATCAHEGKPDDCAELTAFRGFRDGWLREHDGEELIQEYYDIAPGIVTCIDYCDSPAQRYGEIRRRWLTPCYEALREERFADCRRIYVDMVRTLEQRYLN